ncbi:MAG: methyltransferase domain-containing protein [Anaerolineae bacterium]|nr:methyltransferase domain-containing protein [Anaerolineae bacterium]
MDESTVKRLNQINRQFYRVTATDFDESRSQPWAGWDTLLPYLKPPLSVCDTGCGNGRFGVFLADNLGPDLSYVGIDSNSTLLDRARVALSAVKNARFELIDVVEQPFDLGTFDLVAAFGVLHHIPGSGQRRTFMQQLARCVAPGGLLVFAAWCFFEFERFRNRLVPWPDDIRVETHDYLLDWRRGERAIRYCHYIDAAEHADLIAAAGLTELITYRADGRTNDINRYSILRRDSP